MQNLIEQLIHKGGAIVSSNECSVMEIAHARVDNRFAVVENLGYVRRTAEWLKIQKDRDGCTALVAAAIILNDYLDKNCGDTADYPVRIEIDSDTSIVEHLNRLRDTIAEYKKTQTILHS